MVNLAIVLLASSSSCLVFTPTTMSWLADSKYDTFSPLSLTIFTSSVKYNSFDLSGFFKKIVRLLWQNLSKLDVLVNH